MGMFRIVPVDVEAFQFTGAMNEPGWPLGWLDDANYQFEHGGTTIVIEMAGGKKVRARKGDWVIRSANSVAENPYTSLPEYTFDNTYEEVEVEKVDGEAT